MNLLFSAECRWEMIENLRVNNDLSFHLSYLFIHLYPSSLPICLAIHYTKLFAFTCSHSIVVFSDCSHPRLRRGIGTEALLLHPRPSPFQRRQSPEIVTLLPPRRRLTSTRIGGIAWNSSISSLLIIQNT